MYNITGDLTNMTAMCSKQNNVNDAQTFITVKYLECFRQTTNKLCNSYTYTLRDIRAIKKNPNIIYNNLHIIIVRKNILETLKNLHLLNVLI